MVATCSRLWLPPEIWIRVFYWATYCSARDLRGLLELPLFNGITYHEDEALTKVSLRTKSALAVVCNMWRSLSEQFLFEELRIEHGKNILADVLEVSREHCPRGIGKGQYVNRVILPITKKSSVVHGHSRHWADEETSRIIKCCPNLLGLSRYYPSHSVDLEGNNDQQDNENRGQTSPVSISKPDCCSIHDPPLPNLRRLDWHNGTAQGNLSSPSIGAIPSSLWSAQCLEVLSISGDNYLWGPLDLQFLSGRTILLPAVHTLRVASVYTFGVPGVTDYRLALPSLRRIILDRGEALHRLIECVVTSPSDHTKPNVKALEIGSPHWRFLRSDYISTLIRHFPTAESLHYPIFFARPLRWRRIRDNGHLYPSHEQLNCFNSLRHIGLHAELDLDVFHQHNLNRRDKGLEAAIWSHLYAHACALLGSTSTVALQPRVSEIRSVVLHGHSWLPFIIDSRFHFIIDLARARGAELNAEHPRVANALRDVLFGHVSYLVVDWIRGLVAFE